MKIQKKEQHRDFSVGNHTSTNSTRGDLFTSDRLERFPQDMTILNNEFQTILFQYHLKHNIHLTNFIQISLIS